MNASFLAREEDFRDGVFYLTLDAFIQGFEERFTQDTFDLVSSMESLLSLSPSDEEISFLCTSFEVDLDNYSAEVRPLKSRMSVQQERSMIGYDLRNSLGEKELDQCVFKSISKVLKPFFTISLTSCSCEKTSTKLTYVKMKLRFTMSQERFRCLMVPFVEQHTAVSTRFYYILEHFAIKTRKLVFSLPFCANKYAISLSTWQPLAPY